MILSSLLLLLTLGCQSDYAINSIDETVDVPFDGHIEQEWEQLEELSNLDILVALDRSCSMGDDTDRVAAGLSNLIRDIDQGTEFWRLWFTTTDTSRLGDLEPITKDDWHPIDIEMSVALLPSAGGELGLGSSYVYVESNPDIPKAGNDLLIFVISDEDDGSGVQPASYADWIGHLSTPQSKVDFVPIVGKEDSPCADYGFKYEEAAQILGGDSVEFCADGWVNWLNEYSFLTSLSDHAILDEEPIPETIEVSLNSQPFTDWTFEAPRTVWWDILPQAGDRVVIRYEVR